MPRRGSTMQQACKHCDARFCNISEYAKHETTCRFKIPTLLDVCTIRTPNLDKQTIKSEDKHTCKNCGQSFPRKRYLKEHKKVCYQDALACECGLKLEKSYMERHRLRCYITKAKNRQMKQTENLDKVVMARREFPCNKCDCSYQSAELLHDHERSVHRVNSRSKPIEKVSSKISEPSFKYRKSSRGTNHLYAKLSSSKRCASNSRPEPIHTSHGMNASQRCPECKVMIKQRNYHQHLKNHALNCINKKYLASFGTSFGQIYMCRYITCYLAFPSSQELIQHESVHTGVGPYMCGACDKLSESKRKHEQHVKKCASRVLLTYPCSYCGKFFGRLNLLWRHYQSHRPDKMECYSCGHCGEVFPTRLLLNKHNADTHQVIQPKTKSVVLKCNFCLQQLVTQKELLEHTKMYHLANIATTSTVDEPTAGSAIANKAVKQKKIKAFPCRYCDKSFRKESKMARHERIHTNEKPHVCHICGLAFTFKSRLKQHMQSGCITANIKDSGDEATDSETTGSEDLEEVTKEGIDDDVICISSSSSPSPSPTPSSSPTPSPPSPTIGSIQIQRLDPVPVIGHPPSYAIAQISSPDTVTPPNVYTTCDTLPSPRDQVYLIQYDQTHQGPLIITIPNELSSAAIRILPTEQNDLAAPVPVRLERVL